jgi:amino-acid N-acetyltransferase
MINIRRARLSDVPRMMPLLNDYARQAEILPRTEDEVYRSIREWVVAETQPELRIAGMGSLLIMWQDLAEVRSLVVHPDYQGEGLGRQMVNLLLVEARELELSRVFALTRKPGFFLKLGFELTRIEKLPRKVQRDCVFCPKFHSCDEVAVIMSLKESPVVEAMAQAVSFENGRNGLPVIPLRRA